MCSWPPPDRSLLSSKITEESDCNGYGMGIIGDDGGGGLDDLDADLRT